MAHENRIHQRVLRLFEELSTHHDRKDTVVLDVDDVAGALKRVEGSGIGGNVGKFGGDDLGHFDRSKVVLRELFVLPEGGSGSSPYHYEGSWEDALMSIGLRRLDQYRMC
eukprot:PhF_6_TR27179/c0_g5_i1/m.39862